MRQFACLSLISFVSLSLFACSKEPERHVKTPDELLEVICFVNVTPPSRKSKSPIFESIFRRRWIV